MSRSFLAAIRSAVTSPPEPIAHQDDEAGATAPDANAPRGHDQETVMSDDPNKPASASGIPQADHDAMVAAARAEGEAAGAKAATDRIGAVVSSEGISGNSMRIAAAIDLAIKSPGMSAADVSAFITANIAAEPVKPAPSASLANRIAAGGGGNDLLAGADQPNAAEAQAGWGSAVATANARFGKDAA